MKILIVLPKFTLGGVETMCENLATALQKKGHSPVVVSLYTYESAITKRLDELGIKRYSLDKKPGLDFSIKGKLREIIAAEKPDVIHTHLYVTKYVVPAARGCKALRVHTMHNVAAEENLTPMGVTLNKFYFKYCHLRPIAISQKVRETTADMYGYPENEIPIVHNGIDLGKCLPKKDVNIGEDRPARIVNIGRFTEQKNQYELIRAAELLHNKGVNFVLDIYGEGELESSLRAEIADVDYIRLCGTVGDCYEVLSGADVFALPSNYEGLPMTLLEAMGSGLPIVASGVGGVPELIEPEESGLLCHTDAEDIACQLERMIKDEALRKRCAMGALLRSEQYSSEVMAAKYLRVYERLG